MHDPDAQVSGRIGPARDLLVAITLDVRVVHPGQDDVTSRGGQPPALVVQVQPARRGQVVAELLPGQVGFLPYTPARARPHQVARRVVRLGRVHVVGAQHEGAGPV